MLSNNLYFEQQASRMIKLKTKGRAFLFSAISFITIILSCNVSEGIKHEILSEQLKQEGKQIQFTQRVVLREEHGSNHELEVLLNGLYNDVLRKIKLEDDFNPTHVNIEIYNSEEDLQSSLWIANLEKSPSITQPKIEIVKSNIEVIKKRGEASTKKFGLSLEKRKKIFNAVLLAEDEAMKEADIKYPLSEKGNMSKNIELNRKLTKEKKNKILVEYEVEKSILDSITWEGSRLKWDR